MVIAHGYDILKVVDSGELDAGEVDISPAELKVGIHALDPCGHRGGLISSVKALTP